MIKNYPFIIGVMLMSIFSSVAQEFDALPVQSSRHLQRFVDAHFRPGVVADANRSEIEEVLRNAEAKPIEFTAVPLELLLRSLADSAGIQYVGLADPDQYQQTVSLRMEAAPFVALEQMAKAHGIELVFENDVFFMRPKNAEELIAKTYELQYEMLGKYSISASNPNSGRGGTSGGSGIGNDSNSGNTSDGGTSGSRGGGGGSGGASEAIEIDYEQLVTDVQSLIGLSTTGFNANIAAQGNAIDGFGLYPSTIGLPEVGADNQVAGGGAAGGGSQVIFIPKKRVLFVVCTRQQHDYVQAYLESIDKPSPNILVVAKIYETSLNPSTDLGIDWTGILSNRGVTVSGLSLDVDLNDIGPTVLPTASISTSDLSLVLNLLESDSSTRSVSYPAAVSINGTEARFSSTVDIPVSGGSTSVTSGAATTASTVETISVGTTVNVLPVLKRDNIIHLGTTISVSSVADVVQVNGEDQPVTSTRLYAGEQLVKSGHTIVLSGLEDTSTVYSGQGWPWLQNLPIIGALFGNKTKNREDRHLIMLITPVRLDGYEGADSIDFEQFAAPDRGDQERTPYDGDPDTNLEDLLVFHKGIARQFRVYETLAKERRVDKITLVRFEKLANEIALMGVRARELESDRVRGASELVREIKKDLNWVSEIRPRLQHYSTLRGWERDS